MYYWIVAFMAGYCRACIITTSSWERAAAGNGVLATEEMTAAHAYMAGYCIICYQDAVDGSGLMEISRVAVCHHAGCHIIDIVIYDGGWLITKHVLLHRDQQAPSMHLHL